MIGEATAADWPTIWSFFHEIVAAGESFGYDTEMSEHEARAMWLDGPPSRTTVATDDSGVIVGSANMHANRGGPGAHVASATYMVDPARQGRGVGRVLVEDSLTWARHAGFKAMQFNAVVETNERAVGLYESLGFVVVGTVPEAFEHPQHGYVGLHVMHRKL